MKRQPKSTYSILCSERGSDGGKGGGRCDQQGDDGSVELHLAIVYCLSEENYRNGLDVTVIFDPNSFFPLSQLQLLRQKRYGALL